MKKAWDSIQRADVQGLTREEAAAQQPAAWRALRCGGATARIAGGAESIADLSARVVAGAPLHHPLTHPVAKRNFPEFYTVRGRSRATKHSGATKHSTQAHSVLWAVIHCPTSYTYC